MIRAILKTARPRQWTKNGFIFAALVFDGQLLKPEPFLKTFFGFLLLCAISSVVYFINDLADLEGDRAHPLKRNRPLASGALSVTVARFIAMLGGSTTLIAAYWLDWQYGLIISLYLGLNLMYSFWLKHVPIIDVFILASGFVLRVGAGVALITVERFSPWLYVCTTLISLFIGFGKRRAELVLLADGAGSHRRVLDGYNLQLLDQLILIVASTTVMAYSLYTFSAENLPDNHLMMLTIPFVMFGLFRWLYLIHVEKQGGAPDEIVIRDRPLLTTVLLWGMLSVVILYLGS